MKLEVEMLQKEYENVLSGYAMLLAFRLINLCVKADATILLPTIVYVNGEEKKMEDVADVGMRAEDVLDIYPFHEDLIKPIGVAVAEIHPELKQKLETIHVDEQQKDFKYLSLTIPEVDKNRHDILLEGVDAFADLAKGQTDAAEARYTVRLEKELFGRPADETDEAHNHFKETLEDHNKRVKSIIEDKQKEIEDAYKRYQEKQAEKEQSKLEQMAAEGADVKSQLKMPTAK